MNSVNKNTKNIAKNITRVCSIAFVGLWLSGCEFYQVLPKPIVSTVANIFPIDAALVMTTDKTIEDHVVSGASGKDCSTVRREQGRTYCVEDEANPAPKVTCYSSIGDVTCYSKPDENIPKEKVVGSAQY
ncbi:MAG: hypothetical protein KAR80_03820 [Rhodospirillaceae bacterium]|nr:hypothetical protein [Rhodospirillaceae bacterium]MCK5166489.1 hypothetical protein [Rhodospirillaceae bacterium]